jgi:plastocyanin
MRRPPLLVAALAVPAVLAVPGVAAAANVDVSAVDGTAANAFEDVWSPADVGITAGDTVTWRFDGTQVAHNVAPSSANWSMPPSPVGANQAPVTWQFDAAGEYRFACQIHPEMVGRVFVSPPGQPPTVPPPAPARPEPLPNPMTAPSPLEIGGRDRSRPRVTRVRARGISDGARISFRLSERARVTVRVKRSGETVQTRRRSFGAGARRFDVRARALASSRLRLEITALDLAGNRSRPRRVTVRG